MTTTTTRTTLSRTSLSRTQMDSPLGLLTLVASDDGLRAVMWPEADVIEAELIEPELSEPELIEDEPSEAALIEKQPVEDELIEDPTHPVLVAAVAQLEEYFDGKRTDFDLPLDLMGTNFQVACWLALDEIPYGETRTYGEQATSVGRPTATRAVGAANGRNPVSIVLPCHRVIGADGSLTGFGGGLDAKRWLLDHEQSRATPALPFD